MHTTPNRRLRRVGAGIGVGALVASALLITSPAQAANNVVPSNLVDQSETRATGHNVFGDDGIRVYTESNTSTDKAAGYFDVHVSLADAGEPRMSWSPNGSTAAPTDVRPSVQLKTDFDGDGNVDGILVGEPTRADGSDLYGNVWWLSNGSKSFVKAAAPSHSGGYGSDNNGTLDQWRDAFPQANVVQSGWSLGSGIKGDGTINSITVGGEKYFFTKADAVENVKLYESDVDTSSTRSKGHNDFRPTSGVNVSTDAITAADPGDEGHYAGYVNKAAGFFPINQSLSAIGEPTIELRTLSGTTPPGLWLNLDVDDDGIADGTIIKERAYGNDWWLNDTSGPLAEFAPIDGGGSGSDLHGSLAEWRGTLPAGTTVVTSGWSLGGGVEGSYIVDHITVGLKRFSFTGKNRAPSIGNLTASTKVGKAVTVTLNGTDPDTNDVLTYTGTSSDGEVAFAGNKLTFTPNDGFAGKATVSYTVNDGRGGSDTGTATVTVTKYRSSSNITKLSHRKPSVRSNLKVYVTVKAPGTAVTGGKVTIKYKSRTVGTGTVNSAGKVKIALTYKLKSGKRTLTANFAGTDTAAASSDSMTFRVRK